VKRSPEGLCQLSGPAGGPGSTRIEPGEKRNKARIEIETFLGHLPVEFEDLREIFKQALDLLGSSEPDENKLEELDEEIDRHLFELAPEAEKQASLRRLNWIFQTSQPPS